MKAMRLHKIGDFKYEDVELRDIKDDEILMKVEACGICGSDIPRVFELGAHTFPITIGHEFSGVIVDTARQEDKDIIGKKASVFPLIPCRQCVQTITILAQDVMEDLHSIVSFHQSGT